MYIAMNRFKVEHGNEDAFEQRWLNRDIYLKELPGFISFQFLRGPRAEDHTLYVSHTFWNSYDDFINWTKSDAFAQAHHQAHKAKRLTVAPPSFEGYDVLQNVA
ncbi:antibiotic biosynthesis monooxygenase [Acetobacteraceae bacterium ESL0709]|nr:antibiotic biosynthesis monooxygenase [Acetobacteraceae bacterium ESL0697]MDF7678880.1 antibiotic biosynthesis monooxygenase [Acetobacteraceae bacterium ESL0709]